MSGRKAWLVAGLVSAGIVVIQLGWLAVVPPFGGMDEFDHAYRAASVARGHVTDGQPSPDARGELIRVPPDIVTAAHHRCAILEYTAPGNCEAQGAPDSSGDVLVASAASRYNPLYYAIVGTIARPFDGFAALYAMRLATALLCDAFLLTALLIALRRSRSWWPVAGLLVGTSPVIVYASVVAAPNAVQLAAAVLMWTAGLALVTSDRAADQSPARLLAALTAGVSAVLVTHTTGPLWAGTTLVALAVVGGRQRVRELVRRAPRAFWSAAACTFVVGLYAGLWILLAKPNDPASAGTSYPSPTLGALLSRSGAWVLQTVGGIPFRNDAPPVSVFAVAFLGFAPLVVAGYLGSDRRTRGVFFGIAALTLAIPLVLSAVTWTSVGPIWQGRYALPLTVGIPLLAGWALDRSARPADERARTRSSALACSGSIAAFFLVEVITQLHVRAAVEGPHWSPLDGGREWTRVFTVAVVAAVGVFGAVFVVLVRSLDRRSSTDDGRHVVVTAGRSGAPA